MTTRAQSLGAEAASAGSFVEPELQAADREELDAMIESTEGLEVYEHYVDDVMRMKPHTRSAEIEGLYEALCPWVPSLAMETRTVVPVWRSRTKMSRVAPFASLATRLVAFEEKATYRPSAEIDGVKES